MANPGGGPTRETSCMAPRKQRIALPWKLAAAAEYARATGQAAISVMFDLEKAFEKLPHGMLRWLADKYASPCLTGGCC